MADEGERGTAAKRPRANEEEGLLRRIDELESRIDAIQSDNRSLRRQVEALRGGVDELDRGQK